MWHREGRGLADLPEYLEMTAHGCRHRAGLCFPASRLVTNVSLSGWRMTGLAPKVKGDDNRQCPLQLKRATFVEAASRAPSLPPRPASQSQPAGPGPERTSASTSKEQRPSGLQGHPPQCPLIWSINLKERKLARSGRHRGCLRGCN